MIKKFEAYIAAVTGLILIIGLSTLLSTSVNAQGQIDWSLFFTRQLTFAIIGLAIFFVVSKIDYNYYKHVQIIAIFYVLTLVLLLITLRFGIVVNHARRWIVIAGIQLQASEIAKITVLLLTTAVMSMKERYNEWRLALISFLLVIPICVLIYVEPHGSMALIVLALWFLVVFTSLSNQLRNALLLIVVAALAGGVILIYFKLYLIGCLFLGLGFIIFTFGFFSRLNSQVHFLTAFAIGIVPMVLVLGISSILPEKAKVVYDHQIKRVQAFINPTEGNETIRFNVDQAQVAIGSGGLWGKGFGQGTQSKLKFLPEHRTDFIFAAFAEEFGLLGSAFLLLLYGLLIHRILYLGYEHRTDQFAFLLLTGLGFKFLIEVFVNIGTNLGIIPATGIPLPLMSYGGSITLMTFLALGLVQSIVSHNQETSQYLDLIDND